MGTLIFRNIPDLVIERLRAKAAQNSRSGEAEGRAILEQALVLSPESPPFARQVGARLQEVLMRMNDGLWGAPVTLSKLAEMMGLLTVGELEDHFSGRTEAPLPFLDGFASRFGIDADWLKHGKGTPFATHSTGTFSPLDLEKFAKGLAPEIMYLVRNTGGTGELCVVYQIRKWQFHVIPTAWMISGLVGQHGERMLEDLYHLIRRLRDNAFRGYQIMGRDVPDDVYSAMVRGIIYPAQVVDRREHSSQWWDDFTDVKRVYSIAENNGYARYGQFFLDAQDRVADRLQRADERTKSPSNA